MGILSTELTSNVAVICPEEHDIIYVDVKTSHSFMSTGREYLLSGGVRLGVKLFMISVMGLNFCIIPCQVTNMTKMKTVTKVFDMKLPISLLVSFSVLPTSTRLFSWLG